MLNSRFRHSIRLCVVIYCAVLFILAENTAAQITGQNYDELSDDSIIRFSPLPSWFSADNSITHSIAWGDIDNDGDLDLATGGYGIKLYLNEHGVLPANASWSSNEIDNTQSIAWGDMDGDGDLDLAVGNYEQSNRLYLNVNGYLQMDSAWAVANVDKTLAVAWGDVDGDEDLDLATAGYHQPIRIYRNEKHKLQTVPFWNSSDGGATSLAWGDVDHDGDLDLAAGNGGHPEDLIRRNRVYINISNTLQTVATWNAADELPYADGYNSSSVSWGDVDNDGNLDLAIGNWDQPTKIYLNNGTGLQNTARDSLGGAGNYNESIALGDLDGDGDLDLAATVGAFATDVIPPALRIYINDGGSFVDAWNSAEFSCITSMGLSDVDGDGDLDITCSGAGTKLLHNESPGLLTLAVEDPAYFSEGPHSFALGDVDADDDLDLVGADITSEIWLKQNQNGMFQSKSSWFPDDIVDSFASYADFAWGDVDGDGDVDLALGKPYQPAIKVYLNHQGLLSKSASWRSSDGTADGIAWGDMDGDGDLDLAAGSAPEGKVKIYENSFGTLSQTAVWSIVVDTNPDGRESLPVAWGDIDNDGDLDLAARNKIYINSEGVLQLKEIWESVEDEPNLSISWGDFNGDGTLDLASAAWERPIYVYANENGKLDIHPIWKSSSIHDTCVSWGDIDNDGDLDLVSNISLYKNINGQLEKDPTPSVRFGLSARCFSLGDYNSDGNLDLVGSNHIGSDKSAFPPQSHGIFRTIPPYSQPFSIFLRFNSKPTPTFNDHWSTLLAAASFYSQPAIRSESIPIRYTLFHPANEPVREIRAYYSLTGSFPSDRRKWNIAKPTSDTQLFNLSTTPYPTLTITNTHVFTWDILGSGFFGQSDNVVIRIEALPSLKPRRNGTPGSFQHPYVATQTFPFRVRGTQVRVMQANHPAQPATGALVFRLPADQIRDAKPYQNSGGGPFRTDKQGYLQGRSELYPGDKLMALQPISSTKSYTLYYTSATPTASGLDAYTVVQSGIQTLTVSAERPLLLFNLTISLEWDARNDPGYLAQLENDLRRTSQILFDLSNGQAALGDIAIYHDKGNWGSADVIITASNNQRPSAIMGGVVLTGTADLDINRTPIADAYVPGQVRMGATWNRFGEAGGTLGEDWPRTLAHELGHYLFFLSDNYIGVTPDKQMIKMVDCVGSAMTDPYEEGYSEFLPREQWTGECLDTVAERYLGRSDWQSIQKFYPMLKAGPANSGPNQLPLAVTRIQTFAPPTLPQTLAAPFFRLVDGNNTTVIVPNGRGRAYLLKRQGNSDPTDDYLIQLGSPVGDLVQARGAAPGDRLCVYDFSQPVVRLGCLDPVGTTATSVILQAVSQWQPQVQVTGISTNTVVVTVTNVAENNLAVQLLPALGAASAETPMSRQGASFVKTVTAVDGAYYGYLRIWVPGSQPLKELIVEYNALEAWNGRIRFWATPNDAWGGRIRFWAAPAYSWGGRIRFWAAPVMSNDGQVSIFALDNPYANNARYTLQTVVFPPALPTWLTPVGQAYRLSSDGAVPTSAILFSYLERDVPAGYENTLQIYFRKEGQSAWQSIPTQRDPYRNVVSAQAQGAGIYLLAATVEIKPRLAVGWNDIGYTIQQTQTVAAGLASIQGHYSIVRAFSPQANPPWLTYDPNVNPAFAQTVNTLQQLEYGHGYWIHATQAVTLYLDVSPEQVGAAVQTVDLATAGPPAPAEYYGWVLSSTSLTLMEGMSIHAEIDGVLCGATTIKRLAGQLVYHLQVAANVTEETPGCGEPGKFVTLKMGTNQLAQTLPWDNTHTYQVDLPIASVDGIHRLYLPLVNHR